ncbi:hypothetical protein BDV36DRAFT_302137 [Aspergillus pseudocaelatus]|uniref:Uncharacterized protein n=1 Tax=Aspergillus pseudocaelatus TaxID=1825620 RepID=A0ABQ6W1U3_9EURO|nr:hypothetical protein BDV36DRAFT_302137 [Aspergillus pseudocaelatus]
MDTPQEHEISKPTQVMWYIKLKASVRYKWVSKVLDDTEIYHCFQVECLRRAKEGEGKRTKEPTDHSPGIYSIQIGEAYPEEPPNKEEADQKLVDGIQARLDTFYRKNPHMKRRTVKWYVEAKTENSPWTEWKGKIRLNSPECFRFLENCLRITKRGEARVTTDDNSSKDDTLQFAAGQVLRTSVPRA